MYSHRSLQILLCVGHLGVLAATTYTVEADCVVRVARAVLAVSRRAVGFGYQAHIVILFILGIFGHCLHSTSWHKMIKNLFLCCSWFCLNAWRGFQVRFLDLCSWHSFMPSVGKSSFADRGHVPSLAQLPWAEERVCSPFVLSQSWALDNARNKKRLDCSYWVLLPSVLLL